ncbi:TlpA family protein disulfide reductase [Mucilaginibacter lacusdianchii]|uniref:TlpA family protein disulfide reductase n=1 Tax=Mucilaginibacter lacusdianchii TaxID=2684211 RepID=UPI00131E3555|nr:TlpA disulfide reductase family protein [Mucilaginibacter sp. JXJ CY 39]
MKFQIYNREVRADSIYWKIRVIDTLPTIRAKWIGKQFPMANFTDMKGNKLSITDLQGKVLIINCWSVTCGPCVSEIPQLNRVADESAKRGILCLALTYDKDQEITRFFKAEKLKEYIKMSRPEFKFRIIANQKPFLDHSLQVINYPTTFIVDRNGVIREVLEGVNLDEAGKLKSYNEIMSVVAELK